ARGVRVAAGVLVRLEVPAHHGSRHHGCACNRFCELRLVLHDTRSCPCRRRCSLARLSNAFALADVRDAGDCSMTWIRVIAFDQDETLRAAREAQHKLYPIEYAEPTHPHHAQTDGIVASHSLIPDALYHAFAAFGSLMSPELPLSRRQ